jgi:hypothetical protein
MADDSDKLALYRAALEQIRQTIYEPRTTLATVRRRVGQIIGDLRKATGDEAEPLIIRTSDRPSFRETVAKIRKRQADES